MGLQAQEKEPAIRANHAPAISISFAASLRPGFSWVSRKWWPGLRAGYASGIWRGCLPMGGLLSRLTYYICLCKYYSYVRINYWRMKVLMISFILYFGHI